jgi:hypothetical protein
MSLRREVLLLVSLKLLKKGYRLFEGERVALNQDRKLSCQRLGGVCLFQILGCYTLGCLLLLLRDCSSKTVVTTANDSRNSSHSLRIKM